MNWKQYRNEFVALGALLIMLFAYIYKHNKIQAGTQEAKKIEKSLNEIKEAVALKKVWADKKIGKKIEILHTMAPVEKIKWNKKGKKLTAIYTKLEANELNRLITKILNLPVRITLLEVRKIDKNYNVELKCKW